MAYFTTTHEPEDHVWVIHDGGLYRAVVQKVMVEVLAPDQVKVVYICDTGKEALAVSGDDIAPAENYALRDLADRLEKSLPSHIAKTRLEEVA